MDASIVICIPVSRRKWGYYGYIGLHTSAGQACGRVQGKSADRGDLIFRQQGGNGDPDRTERKRKINYTEDSSRITEST